MSPVTFSTKTASAFVSSLVLCLLITIGSQAQDNSNIITQITVSAEPEVIQTTDSSDGSSYAEVIAYPCTDVEGQAEGDSTTYAYEQINLIEGDQTTMITEQLISCGGLGTFGLWITHWTENGEYLYYTDGREGQPDGGTGNFWRTTQWRVHLPDMQIVGLSNALFSPDRLHIMSYFQGQITISGIDGEDETIFEQTPNDLQITNILWLPDKSGLIYVQSDNVNGPATRSTVTFIDLRTNTQTVIVDSAS